MEQAIAYLPRDRCQALLTGRPLPEQAVGAVLFVDISGFTPLTEALAHQFGRSRGAELLTQALNAVYQALIDQVDRHNGSVIGFAGDAITCWFDGKDSPQDAGLRGLAAAHAMQRACAQFAAHKVAPGVIAELALKIAMVSGEVRRLLVGDPSIQVIEALAGAALDRMAAVEHVAQRGELVADRETIDLLDLHAFVAVWRPLESGQWAGVLTGLDDYFLDRNFGESERSAEASPFAAALPAEQLRPWLLPTVWNNLRQGEEHYLAELRPAAALFLRFSGIDFENDPAASAHLDAFIRYVQQLLVEHEGALIQLTTGDKGSYLYAAFGAPIAHDDDAARAVAVALALRNSAGRFAFIRQMQFGVGAGMMRVGAYGSSTRRTYGVLGDETNVAARLMMQAAPGQILISARVAEMVQARYLLEPLGLRTFKGKREPQPVYAVTGLRTPTTLQLAALYPERPIGREREVEAIAGAIQRAAVQQGRLVRIEGEAGVGKSHLAATAAHLASQQGFTLLYSSCQSIGQQPYGALSEPLAHLLGLAGLRAEPVETQIAHLHSTLHALDPAWSVRLPLLGDLFDLPIPDNPTTAAFDVRLRRAALTALVVDLLGRAAQQKPIFLLVEDVHWLNEADQEIVLALARATMDQALLFCMTHRPVNAVESAFFNALEKIPDQLRLSLGELSAPAIAALTEERLQAPVAALVIDLVYAYTRGNPFFAEEMIDALREQGQIALSEGVWQPSRLLLHALHEAGALERVEEQWRLRPNARLDAVTLGIPDTVHGLVLSRLDSLAEETRLTLKVAAVIGRAFEPAVLREAHPRRPPTEALHRQITELVQRNFIYTEPLFGEPVYVFKHSISHEALCQTLLESQRRELHLAVGEALERHAPHAVERLAHHFLQADDKRPEVRNKVIRYLDAAAWRAKRSFANETALAYFERALSLETRWQWLAGKAEVLHILGLRLQEEATLMALEALPDGDCVRPLELWADFYEATSQFPQARATLQEALERYKTQHNLLAQGRILSRIGEIALLEGDIDEAEQYHRRALTLLSGVDQRDRFPADESRAMLPSASDAAGLDSLRAQALLGLGVVMRQRGHYDEAVIMLTEALRLYEKEGNQPEVATALTRLGGVAYLRRDFPEALAAWEKALAIRRTIGDREGEGSSLLNIAQVYTSLGDYAAALPLLYQALDIQRTVGNRWWENAVWNALGIIALTVGDYAEARRCLTTAERLSASVGDEAGVAIAKFNLAQVERECGDDAAAFAWLQEAQQWAHENEDREFEAQCLTELALTAERAGELDQAEAFANAALRIYEGLDIQALTTTDLATLALVHLARGQIDAACALIDAMLRIFDQSEIHQVEYPQRALYVAACVAAASRDQPLAKHCLDRARSFILERAAKISDEKLRRSYLENVRINRLVLEAAQSA